LLAPWVFGKEHMTKNTTIGMHRKLFLWKGEKKMNEEMHPETSDRDDEDPNWLRPFIPLLQNHLV
jgi:hypothetical protein